MSRVTYKQVQNKDEAYKVALGQITPEYIEKWKINADISYDEAGKKITATGKGFKLCLNFQDSDCVVDLDLSFLLKPLRGTIMEQVEKKLNKHL